MKNPVRTFQSRRARRKHDRLAHWEQTRRTGKLRFVVRTALIWGGAMIVMNMILRFLFNRGPSLGTVIYFIVVAPIVALVMWWANEGIYKNAKLDNVIKRYR